MDAETVLKPCPFCGGPADVEHLENGKWSVGCRNVDGCIGWLSSFTYARKAEAIAAWNTRPTVDAPAGLVERLREFFVEDEDGNTFHPEICLEAAAALTAKDAEIAALRERVRADELLSWLDGHRNLELTYYRPTYCDDDDVAEEWRVYQRSGSINDREWTQVGQGETPVAAISAARALLEPEAGK